MTTNTTIIGTGTGTGTNIIQLKRLDTGTTSKSTHSITTTIITTAATAAAAALERRRRQTITADIGTSTAITRNY